MKKLVVILAFVLYSCCDQEQRIYKVQLKLVDSSWTGTYLIKADKSPEFRIDCYSSDCGQTALMYQLNCDRKRFNRPGIIDYRIVK